ncbi:MAG: LLM class flavin-dependent oxidoreductase [Actinomycetota bacterium]|nr:LLM class flavin-dependent oxidoreductase [Actinomycetota bacterium]
MAGLTGPDSEPTLSILDQCPVPAGLGPTAALADSVALASAAEQLGYRRYWVAEHHNTPSLASPSPEIVVAAAAARTTSIRVGSGGVLLPHYSPLKVAESFRLLDALYPGRVDLGVGRAAGSDPVTEAALQYRPGALGDEHFAQKVEDLLGFLDGALDPDHPYARVRAVPQGPGGPEVWILGSSSQGAACAAYLGLPFAFAHFISAQFGAQVMNGYKRGFMPSSRLDQPRASVAVSVLCAETDAEARRLSTSAAAWGLRPEGPERGPLLAPGEAARGLTGVEQARLAQRRAGMVVGAPDQVRAALVDLTNAFGVDEVVALTVCHDPLARLRSYELLAEAFALVPKS